MTKTIPSTSEVRGLLQRIKQPEIELMSAQSGVPVPTIIKIRHGVTAKPGLDTVRLLFESEVIRKKIKSEKAKNKGKLRVDSMTCKKSEA